MPWNYRETIADSQQVEICFRPAARILPGKSPKACLWPRGVHQEQREASAQFFSNDGQFNTTDTGANAAVEVTGMGKRNLLPSGLIAHVRTSTPACDALSIPAGLKIVLGELEGEFTLPVTSTDIMLRSGARYNSSLPLGFQRALVPPPLETCHSPPFGGVSVEDFGSNSRRYTSVFPSRVD